MAESWNHLEVTSLTCLVVDDVSKLLPRDVSWGCWLKHLLEPLCVVWASLQHNGLRVVFFFLFISFHSTLFYFIWWFSASIMRVCTGKAKLYRPVSGAIQWHFLCTLLIRSKSLNPTRFKGRDRTSPLSKECQRICGHTHLCWNHHNIFPCVITFYVYVLNLMLHVVLSW